MKLSQKDEDSLYDIESLGEIHLDIVVEEKSGASDKE